MVGTRVGTGDSENTDGDKFDDGQELFGTTYCPGAPLSCGYGSYPRTQDFSFITSAMPSWIRPPGDSPFVAAYPVIEFLVDPNTIRVTTKEIHTIERTITEGEEISTGFAETEGNSTTVGTVDTNTHSTWQEHSTTEGGIEPAALTYASSAQRQMGFTLAPELPKLQSLTTGDVLNGAEESGSFGSENDELPVEFLILDVQGEKSLGLLLPTRELAIRYQEGDVRKLGVFALDAKFLASGDLLFIDNSLALRRLGSEDITTILPPHSANGPLFVNQDQQRVAYLKPKDYPEGSDIPLTNGIAVMDLANGEEQLLFAVSGVTIHLYGWSGDRLVVEVPYWSPFTLNPADNTILGLLHSDHPSTSIPSFASLPAVLPNSPYPQTSFDQKYIAYQSSQGVVVASLVTPTYALLTDARSPRWTETGLEVVHDQASTLFSLDDLALT